MWIKENLETPHLHSHGHLYTSKSTYLKNRFIEPGVLSQMKGVEEAFESGGLPRTGRPLDEGEASSRGCSGLDSLELRLVKGALHHLRETHS